MIVSDKKYENLRPAINLVSLAINTSSNISTTSAYIVFLTEMQKRQILRNGFALLKNDITTIFYGYDTCVFANIKSLGLIDFILKSEYTDTENEETGPS